MKIEINNIQQTCRPDIPLIRKLVRGLMIKAQALNRESRWSAVSVILSDNSQIRTAKARLFGIDEVTDVISQRYTALPGEGGRLSGEIHVNVQRALESHPASWNASRELALYIAHGCDHLMDARDDTSAGRMRMRRRELRWLSEKDIAALARKTLKTRAGVK